MATTPIDVLHVAYDYVYTNTDYVKYKKEADEYLKQIQDKITEAKKVVDVDVKTNMNTAGEINYARDMFSMRLHLYVILGFIKSSSINHDLSGVVAEFKEMDEKKGFEALELSDADRNELKVMRSVISGKWYQDYVYPHYATDLHNLCFISYVLMDRDSAIDLLTFTHTGECDSLLAAINKYNDFVVKHGMNVNKDFSKLNTLDLRLLRDILEGYPGSVFEMYMKVARMPELVEFVRVFRSTATAEETAERGAAFRILHLYREFIEPEQVIKDIVSNIEMCSDAYRAAIEKEEADGLRARAAANEAEYAEFESKRAAANERARQEAEKWAEEARKKTEAREAEAKRRADAETAEEKAANAEFAERVNRQKAEREAEARRSSWTRQNMSGSAPPPPRARASAPPPPPPPPRSSAPPPRRASAPPPPIASARPGPKGQPIKLFDGKKMKAGISAQNVIDSIPEQTANKLDALKRDVALIMWVLDVNVPAEEPKGDEPGPRMKEARKKYKKLMLAFHTDKHTNASKEETEKLNAALRRLSAMLETLKSKPYITGSLGGISWRPTAYGGEDDSDGDSD